MPLGVKDSRRHRYIGEKRSSPMLVLGNKQHAVTSKGRSLPSNKESHDIYNHSSNSGIVQRLPMLHTNHHEARQHGGGLSHIEKHRKLDHSNKFF